MFLAQADTTVAWATAASLLISAVVASFVAWSHFRTDTQAGNVATFTAVVNGMKDLLDERQHQIDDLEGRIEKQTKEIALLREAVDRANAHVVECERDLRNAFRRIHVLEERNGRT